jgi:hypothetical protein
VQRVQRAERAPRVERVQRIQRQERIAQRVERAPRIERAQRIQRQEPIAQRAERTQRANRIDRQQVRTAERQQLRDNRVERVQGRLVDRQELRANRLERREDRIAARNAIRNERIDRVRAFQPLSARFVTPRGRVLPFGQAVRFVGEPVRNVRNVVTFAALPSTVSYLYPDTADWYYRYGDGYMYRIDRRDDVIDWVLPLMAGGYMPGQYLPNYYMSSYVPSYYGFNSFYPDYGNDCHRYGYGVVYEVDCFTGLVEDVIPLYAGGYGVGQLLPSSYSYYNVPFQYRSLYYDTPNYGYWYAPGAIYQYDRDTALISSVAALLSPGFAVGQPLPLGYNAYNVPYGYRQTYYDTPNAWYRYNNGYIYQVNPTTLLVTAIVASALT